MREHVQQEQELSVADSRRSGGEPPGTAPLVLRFHRRLVPLPVLAVRRIRDQVIKLLARESVVGKRGSEEDVLRVATCRRLHVDVGLHDRERLGVHLLPEQVDVGPGVDRPPDDLAVHNNPLGDVILRDRQHPAGTAARIAHREHDARFRDPLPVAGQHEIDHQVNHVARREVLARILVQPLVELPDQLLEDRPHRRIVDRVRMQIDVLEPFHDLEQEPASSSFEIVLSKSNFSSTSRMLELNPAM